MLDVVQLAIASPPTAPAAAAAAYQLIISGVQKQRWTAYWWVAQHLPALIQLTARQNLLNIVGVSLCARCDR